MQVPKKTWCDGKTIGQIWSIDSKKIRHGSHGQSIDRSIDIAHHGTSGSQLLSLLGGSSTRLAQTLKKTPW